jgi:hypothetical protein
MKIAQNQWKVMKNMIHIPQIRRCLVVLAAIAGFALLLGQPTQSYAADGSAKGGAGKLIQLKRIQTGEDLQKVEAGDTIVMSCPKCKESYAQVTEQSFKAVTGDQLKTVKIHLCDGCETKIVTKGHGKMAKNVVVHTCKACGSKDVSCCVMKKGDTTPTPGMEKK